MTNKFSDLWVAWLEEIHCEKWHVLSNYWYPRKLTLIQSCFEQDSNLSFKKTHVRYSCTSTNLHIHTYIHIVDFKLINHIYIYIHCVQKYYHRKIAHRKIKSEALTSTSWEPPGLEQRIPTRAKRAASRNNEAT